MISVEIRSHRSAWFIGFGALSISAAIAGVFVRFIYVRTRRFMSSDVSSRNIPYQLELIISLNAFSNAWPFLLCHYEALPSDLRLCCTDLIIMKDCALFLWVQLGDWIYVTNNPFRSWLGIRPKTLFWASRSKSVDWSLEMVVVTSIFV